MDPGFDTEINKMKIKKGENRSERRKKRRGKLLNDIEEEVTDGCVIDTDLEMTKIKKGEEKIKRKTRKR